MKLLLKNFFSPPIFESETRRRVASIINIILLTLALSSILFFLSANFARESSKIIRILSLSIFLTSIGLKLLLNQGRLRVISIMISLTTWAPFTILIFSFDGIRDTAITGYFLATIITSLLLNTSLLALFTFLGSLSLTIAYFTEVNGILITSVGHLPSPVDIVAVLITLNTTALLAGLTVRKMRQGDEETREERNKAQDYLNIAGSIIVALDKEQKITLINKRGCEVLGYSESEILGKDWVSSFLPENIREKIRADLAVFMTGNEIKFVDSHENPVLTKSGAKRDIVWYNTLLRDNKGAVIGALSSGEDITERLQATHELEKRYLYLEGLLAAVPDAIITMNADHHVEEWNQGAEKLFGYSSNETFNKEIDSLIAAPDVLDEAVSFTKMATSGLHIPSTETVRYRKDGSAVDVILAGSPILIENELVGTVTVYTDISKLKKMEKELAHLATHDPLTNLPNRTLLQDRLEHALKRSARQQDRRRADNKWDIALLMIDLDDFKAINDNYGHAIGDLLLQRIARRLESVVRSSDTVARMGGDEFIVIFENISQNRDSAILADKVLNLFSEPFALGEHNINIGASIGVSLHPRDGEDFEKLSTCADKAMYEAKRTKNSYRCYSEKEENNPKD